MSEEPPVVDEAPEEPTNKLRVHWRPPPEPQKPREPLEIPYDGLTPPHTTPGLLCTLLDGEINGLFPIAGVLWFEHVSGGVKVENPASVTGKASRVLTLGRGKIRR